jgi:HK97 family phage major capsid protein
MPDSDLSERFDKLLGEMAGLNRRIDEARAQKATADGAADGQAAVAAQLAEADKARRKEEVDAAVKAALAEIRAPSLAAIIGGGAVAAAQAGRMRVSGGVDPAPALKASITDYQAGELLTALLDVRSIETGGLDIEAVGRGKAKLAELGATWWGAPGKAILGATGATGGFVLPNNLVDQLIKPATQAAIYTGGANPLMTIVNGVNVRGVDMPYRTGAPTRMTFQDWGTTKDNVNEAYGSYTATLGTLARIIDIGKQYARFSAGAAEADVVDELTRAAQLAENYYVIHGAGTGSVGTGDPTTGVYTALTTGFGGAYTTVFAGASGSTILGSGAAALLAAIGAVAGRNQEVTGIVTDSTSFFSILGQGSDAAGFWVDPTGGPTGFTRTASGGIAFWGIPLFYDTTLNVNTGTTKIAIAANWKKFKFYRGMEFRIDTSDVAGTRWDQNLIGFRGEEEIGFNAYPGIITGAAQLVTGIIP